MDTKTITIRLTPEIDRQIRIEAAKRDLDRSAFIRKTLIEKLDEIKQKEAAEKTNDE